MLQYQQYGKVVSPGLYCTNHGTQVWEERRAVFVFLVECRIMLLLVIAANPGGNSRSYWQLYYSR
jgi:hypothetical protein